MVRARRLRSLTAMPDPAGRAMTLIVVLGCCLALGACGGGGSTAATTTTSAARPKVVDIYSSLPLSGRDRIQVHGIVNGIRLALFQNDGRAGQFRVRYR